MVLARLVLARQILVCECDSVCAHVCALIEVCGKTFINIPFMTSVLCPQRRRAYICLSHLLHGMREMIEHYVCQCVCVCE